MNPIRLLSVIEATTITGPAKNLLGFAGSVRQSPEDPSMEVVITTFQRDGASTLFADTVRGAGIPFFPIVERGRFDRDVIAQLADVARRVKPDLIQSHGVKSHFLVRLAGLHQRVPWIAFHHGYTWPDFRMRVYNQLDRWSLRAAQRVLTVSRPFQRELVRNGVSPHRIEVVHNAIDPEWASQPRSQEIAALREKLAILPDQQVILIVGRLSNEKDHRTLVQAIHHLKTRTSLNPRLLIVGDGPRRSDLVDQVRRLNLTGVVTFVEHTPSAELYYRIADVSVLSSLSEGSPNVLLEAMAARVPVVATAVGGIPEMVSDGESALLVRPRDAEGIATAIARVLNEEPLRKSLVTSAYQRLLAGHTPEIFTRRLQQIYRETLHPPAG